jgi:hypothetical protein
MNPTSFTHFMLSLVLTFLFITIMDSKTVVAKKRKVLTLESEGPTFENERPPLLPKTFPVPEPPQEPVVPPPRYTLDEIIGNSDLSLEIIKATLRKEKSKIR